MPEKDLRNVFVNVEARLPSLGSNFDMSNVGVERRAFRVTYLGKPEDRRC